MNLLAKQGGGGDDWWVGFEGWKIYEDRKGQRLEQNFPEILQRIVSGPSAEILRYSTTEGGKEGGPIAKFN